MVELAGSKARSHRNLTAPSALTAMFTDRQQEILDFIRDQQSLRGVPPAGGEIQEHFGLASPNAVPEHLKAWERKGALHRGEKTPARGLVLTDTSRARPMVEIPI